jgi:hypothetical protein
LDRGQKQTDLFNQALATIEEGGSIDYIKAYLAENGADGATMSKVDKYYNEHVDKAITELYNEYVSKIKEGTLTIDEVDSSERNGNITGDQAKKLRNMLTGNGAYHKTKAVWNADGSEIKNKAGDNFSVSYDGDIYRVQVAEQVLDEAILSYAERNIEDGGVFMDATNTNAPVYIYKNGNVYRVGARGGMSVNKHDLAQLRKALWDAIPS